MAKAKKPSKKDQLIKELTFLIARLSVELKERDPKNELYKEAVSCIVKNNLTPHLVACAEEKLDEVLDHLGIKV